MTEKMRASIRRRQKAFCWLELWMLVACAERKNARGEYRGLVTFADLPVLQEQMYHKVTVFIHTN